MDLILRYNPVTLPLKWISTSWSWLQPVISHFSEIILGFQQKPIKNYLILIGQIYLTYKFLRLANSSWFFFQNLIRQAMHKKDTLANRYGRGSYAIITGFTEGIGWSMALQLADAQFKLVLVGRNKEKIDRRVNELRKYYPLTQVEIIEADFSTEQGKERALQGIGELASKIDISILVNNVAAVGGGPYFMVPEKLLFDTIDVNVHFTLSLNKLMIPILTKRKQRSAIINLSSCTGHFISPYVGSYSATKVYLDIYSRTLRKEYSDKIDVLTVRPFGVSTPMMKYKKGPLMTTSDVAAKWILIDLPYDEVTYGAPIHKLSKQVFSSYSEQGVMEVYRQIWGIK